MEFDAVSRALTATQSAGWKRPRNPRLSWHSRAPLTAAAHLRSSARRVLPMRVRYATRDVSYALIRHEPLPYETAASFDRRRTAISPNNSATVASHAGRSLLKHEVREGNRGWRRRDGFVRRPLRRRGVGSADGPVTNTRRESSHAHGVADNNDNTTRRPCAPACIRPGARTSGCGRGTAWRRGRRRRARASCGGGHTVDNSNVTRRATHNDDHERANNQHRTDGPDPTENDDHTSHDNHTSDDEHTCPTFDRARCPSQFRSHRHSSGEVRCGLHRYRGNVDLGTNHSAVGIDDRGVNDNRFAGAKCHDCAVRAIGTPTDGFHADHTHNTGCAVNNNTTYDSTGDTNNTTNNNNNGAHIVDDRADINYSSNTHDDHSEGVRLHRADRAITPTARNC